MVARTLAGIPRPRSSQASTARSPSRATPSLTMDAGLYIIEGGGFQVAGNAAVTGAGVTLYNAGSKFPNSGGSFGAISSAATARSRSARRPPAICRHPHPPARRQHAALSFSGNAMAGVSGTIHAPAAELVESGNAPDQRGLHSRYHEPQRQRRGGASSNRAWRLARSPASRPRALRMSRALTAWEYRIRPKAQSKPIWCSTPWLSICSLRQLRVSPARLVPNFATPIR